MSRTASLQNCGAIYQSLPLKEQQIRLITLQPGLSNEQIRCELAVSDIFALPSYEALSYVWGDPQKAQHIKVNDRSFRIGKNLHDALLRLRWVTRVRRLWIDAICIDQMNLQERNHQVTLMQRIYMGAVEVIVWLGEEDSVSRMAMHVLDRLSQQPRGPLMPTSTGLRERYVDKDNLGDTCT